MKCDKIDMGHGQFAFVCTRGRRHNCQFCSRYATKQCDFPVLKKNGKPGTCDKWLCDRCAAAQATTFDFCPPHDRWVQKMAEDAAALVMPEYEDEERIVER